MSTQPNEQGTGNLDTAADNREAFIQRLMSAGWPRKEAEEEYDNIQNDEERP